MPSPISEVADVATSRLKFTWKSAAAAAAKYGFNAIVCCAVAWLLWGQLVKHVDADRADAKLFVDKAIADAAEANTYIRDQLMKQNERQGRMIAVCMKTIEINTEHLKQGSELMKATQRCLEECVALYGQLLRLMEKVSARLDRLPPPKEQAP